MEYIKKAIEKSEQMEVVRILDCEEAVQKYRDYTNETITDYEIDNNIQVADFIEGGSQSHRFGIYVVYQKKSDPSNVVVLNMVGTKNDDGTTYPSEEWDVEKVFQQPCTLWDEYQQEELIHKRYTELYAHLVKYVFVSFEDDGEVEDEDKDEDEDEDKDKDKDEGEEFDWSGNWHMNVKFDVDAKDAPNIFPYKKCSACGERKMNGNYNESKEWLCEDCTWCNDDLCLELNHDWCDNQGRHPDTNDEDWALFKEALGEYTEEMYKKIEARLKARALEN